MKFPPFAKSLGPIMKTRGTYARGFPLGAVVHFTAGHDGAEKTIRGGVKDGYTYYCIQRDGLLVCAHDVTRWGYHAGKSAWGELARKALNKVGLGSSFKPLVGATSDDLIGIEMNAAGMVKKQANGTFITWFKTILQPSEVRYTAERPDCPAGFYHKYTPAQEKTLVETLFWLKDQKPDVFSFDLVLGHSEIAGKRGIGSWRKNDPGAALSMSMDDFRKFLKREYAKRHGKSLVPDVAPLA